MDSMNTSMRVYIEDTDAGGIVYYVNYLKFMERARTEFMRSLGFGKTALWDELMFVVHSVNVDYKRPAKLDDLITVSSIPVRASRVSLYFEQDVTRDGELLCSGMIKVACVDRNTMKPAKMPQELLEKIKIKNPS